MPPKEFESLPQPSDIVPYVDHKSSGLCCNSGKEGIFLAHKEPPGDFGGSFLVTAYRREGGEGSRIEGPIAGRDAPSHRTHTVATVGV
jgi:hypothetical protein